MELLADYFYDFIIGFLGGNLNYFSLFLYKLFEMYVIPLLKHSGSYIVIFCC